MTDKRNRIVIDLGSAGTEGRPAGSSRRPGRGRRILGIIAAILVVIVVGAAAAGYFWWRHYQNQPGYSLALLIDAAQRNDNAVIDRLLDMDKITDNFVSQVRQRAAASYPSVIGAIPSAPLEQSAATASPRLKKTLHDELPGEIKRLTAPAAGKPFALIAIAVPYFLSVNASSDKTAVATAKVKDEHIQLMMQEVAAGQWRIVAIEDDRLAGIVADSIKKDLPLPGTPLQDQIQRKLKGLKWPSTQ